MFPCCCQPAALRWLVWQPIADCSNVHATRLHVCPALHHWHVAHTTLCTRHGTQHGALSSSLASSPHPLTPSPACLLCDDVLQGSATAMLSLEAVLCLVRTTRVQVQMAATVTGYVTWSTAWCALRRDQSVWVSSPNKLAVCCANSGAR